MGFAPTGALLQGNLRVTDSREGPRYDGGLWPGRAATGGSRRAANWTRLSPVVVGTIWGLCIPDRVCQLFLIFFYFFFDLCHTRVRPPDPEGPEGDGYGGGTLFMPQPLGRWCKYAPHPSCVFTTQVPVLVSLPLRVRIQYRVCEGLEFVAVISIAPNVLFPRRPRIVPVVTMRAPRHFRPPLALLDRFIA